MGNVRKDYDDRRPGHVAIVDDETGKFKGWDEKRERENPVFEAENPSELVTQENPSDSNHQSSSSMERENAVSEVASEFLEKAKPGLGIVAGNAIAAEVFDYLDRGPLSGQSSTVRKVVRIFGPGLAGVLVGRASDSELVRSVALGHVTESVRAGVEETLAFVSNGQMGSEKGKSGNESGDGESQPDSGTEGYPALSGRSVDPSGDLAGGYSSKESDSLTSTGTEETVM